MLKKLRIKFTALNMATVAVVLTVVFAAICVVNHRQSVATVDGALNQAIAQACEHQGRQMGKDALGEDQPDGEQPAPDGVAAPPTIGGRERSGEQVIPVALFSMSSDGDMTALGRFNTASISQDVLEQAGEQLVGADEGFGSLSDLGLFYMKRQSGGVMYLAFADMGSASGWRALAATLAVVEVAALAVFLVISLFFSRWALRPVARAWTQQRRFVADASHDLKTPLTVILANTSIALEHPERSVASQSQWLESTQHEAEAMQGLVGDLLTLAKMDEGEAAAQSGAARPALEEVDLSDVIEGEVLQFESVAFERGVKLGSQVEPGIKLRGNEQRLRRLAGTLIDNACKYVDDGGSGRRGAFARGQAGETRGAQHRRAHIPRGPSPCVRPFLPRGQGTHGRRRRARLGACHRARHRRGARRRADGFQHAGRRHRVHRNVAAEVSGRAPLPAPLAALLSWKLRRGAHRCYHTCLLVNHGTSEAAHAFVRAVRASHHVGTHPQRCGARSRRRHPRRRRRRHAQVALSR